MSAQPTPTRVHPGLLYCFLLSGAAALIYEVLWTRSLVLVVGGTRTATTMVLAAFMVGLALGSALAGPYVDRIRRPLRFYALLEIGIAALGLAMPWLLEAVGDWHAAAYRTSPGALSLGLIRFGLSALCVMVPAALMGATFPAMLRSAARSPESVGRSVSAIYAVNTAGGVLGCLLAAFVLIPELGLRATGYAAVLLNLVVAAVTWTYAEPAGTAETRADGGERAPLWPLGAAAVVGFTSLAYEVAWTRVLTLILGTTVYAFSIMLASFLTGIAVGAAVARRFTGRPARVTAAAGIAQAAVSVLTLLWVWGIAVPFELMGRMREELGDSFLGFSAARFLLAFALLSTVTVPMGMTLPLLIATAHRRFPRLGRDGGAVYAANTIGAVGGVLAAGLWLLPRLGVHFTLVTLAAVNAAVGAAFLAAATSTARSRLGLAATGTACVLAGFLAIPRVDPRLLNTGVYQYSDSIAAVGFDAYVESTELLFYEEGVNASVAVTRREGILTLQTNGKTDGGVLDDPTQLMLGYAPMLLHEHPRSVLVIGYGLGASLGAAMTFPAERLVCVEIEPAVLRAARLFEDHYGRRPTADPRVEVVLEDARLFCRATDETFDVVISQPSNPWHVGVSNLFTVEFFEMLKARTAPGGVVCIWVPLYGMTPDHTRMVFRTVQQVFPHATMWQSSPQNAMLLARRDGPLTVPLPTVLDAFAANATMRSDLRRIGIHDAQALIGQILIDAAHLERFSKDAPLNTDDRPLLEFLVPRSEGGDESNLDVNRAILRFYKDEQRAPHLQLEYRPFARPGDASRLDGVGLHCRPNGRSPKIRFYGMTRMYSEYDDPGSGDTLLGQNTVETVEIDADGADLILRSERRDAAAKIDLWGIMTSYGAAGPESFRVGGHDGLVSRARNDDGWYAILVWHCPATQRVNVAAYGPTKGRFEEADAAALELRCLHPGP